MIVINHWHVNNDESIAIQIAYDVRSKHMSWRRFLNGWQDWTNLIDADLLTDKKYDPAVTTYSCSSKTILGINFVFIRISILNDMADGVKRQAVWLPFNIKSEYFENFISTNGNIWEFSCSPNSNGLYVNCIKRVENSTNYFNIRTWMD